MVGILQTPRERRHLVRHRLAADPDRPRRPWRHRRLVPAADRDPAPATRRRRRPSRRPRRPPRSPAAADPRDISGAWHHAPEMTDQAERYDRSPRATSAGGRRSSPRAVGRLIDRLGDHVDGAVRASSSTSGPGPAQLALGAIARWPRLSGSGIDASREMCARASTPRPTGGLTADARARFDARSPSPPSCRSRTARFDLAVSSFVLQLVPNRTGRSARSAGCCGPAGRFASVTWLADRPGLRAGPDLRRAARRVRVRGRRPATTVRATSVGRDRGVEELRRAGFRDVDASASALEHRVHGRRLHRVPDRVRRGVAVRGHEPGRAAHGFLAGFATA